MKKDSLGQEQVRSFSRSFSRSLGLLEAAPYDPSLNLVESRIIFELSRGTEQFSKSLAASLSLDKGYLSRTIRGLRRRGLVELRESAEDRRKKAIRLTARGTKLFRRIDRVSRERTERLIEAAGPLRGRAFVQHLSAAELVLASSAIEPREVSYRSLLPGDLGWVIGRHGEVYHQEFGWSQEFEVLVAEIALGFARKHDPACERAWIAEARGVRLGCVFLVRESRGTAKLRILLVDPLARGLGIGTGLVSRCIAFAREAGYSQIVLWTNDVLGSARKIYESQGFRLEREEPHHSFGKKLNGQYWALQTQPGSGKAAG